MLSWVVFVCVCGWECQHFTAAGFPCPPLRNPSDHFLRAINSDFDKVKSNLKGSFKIRVRFRNLISN
jgi:hypothetical protein